MESLNHIVDRESLPVPDFHLDHFQSRILQELHLEFFLATCRCLITPNFRHLTTGEATAEEEARLLAILTQRQELLEQLKRYLLYDLALHSALLEANSYFISVNEHLVIARFVGRPEGFEVKLYTLRPEDLPARYADKIYLGRDLLCLDEPRREHFSLRFMRDSLREQLAKLGGRLEVHAPESLRPRLQREFLGDLQELVDEASLKADGILGALPSGLPLERLEETALLDLNDRFRELKHILLEADEVLLEMEQRLFERAPAAARYVTKMRKDVTNDVTYILLKVNGRISDAVNGIRFWSGHDFGRPFAAADRQDLGVPSR
jgi:hypothetical protein